MIYFGGSPTQQMHNLPDGYTTNEWYRYNFLGGAEWYNLVSPSVQIHIPNILDNAINYPELIVSKLPCGSIAVKVRKDIAEIDTHDLFAPKVLLYDALYPGTMHIDPKYILDRKATGLIAKPRKRWEHMPLLENEICITPDRIIFQHITRFQSE